MTTPVPDPLVDFVTLSAILTGIAADQLHPFLDTHGTAQAYLDYATAHAPAAFAQLMAVYDQNRAAPPAEIASAVFASSNAIARTVMLMWYLGAWYAPDALAAFVAAYQKVGASAPPAPFVVISSDAYTQGWAWRVGQTHPMGYSDFLFGYWNTSPPPLAAFVGSAQ